MFGEFHMFGWIVFTLGECRLRGRTMIGAGAEYFENLRSVYIVGKAQFQTFDY